MNSTGNRNRVDVVKRYSDSQIKNERERNQRSLMLEVFSLGR